MFTLLAAVSCEHEIADLTTRLDDLESRVSRLEELCSQMNSNISSLQSIVAAVQAGDYITSVNPVTEGDKTVGYTITFAKGDPITIYHGQDGADGQNGKDGANGQDGHTPVIGVQQDKDGVWYWTLDDQWLLDGNGQKVKAAGVDGKDGQNGKDGADGKDGQPGADGKDGVTPLLKIEDGYWYVSTDNGITWTKLGKATGDNGKDGTDGKDGQDGVGGDSMFTHIDYTSSADYVIFVLSNGIELKVPTWYAFEELKTFCDRMNANIEALQTIVEALQTFNYVSSVTAITENGQEIGYLIAFSNGDTITVYHGKDGVDGQDGENGVDGRDGQTPVIGVQQDTDGIWYWTLDGQWLLDANGKKVKAVGADGKNGEDGKDGTDGADGKDGITPQLKIEDGYWNVSLDYGVTWTQLGKATGDNGKDGTDGKDGQDGVGGDSMFTHIDYTSSADYVIFTLSNGQTFSLLKTTFLSIEFDSEDLIVMSANATRDIHYTISTQVEDITIEAFGAGGVNANVEKSSSKEGKIRVKTGDMLDEFSKVVVLVSNGTQAIMRTLKFDNEDIKVEEETIKEIGSAGGTIELEFFANVECQVEIPESAKEWIVEVPSTKALTKCNLALFVKSNTGGARRADVQIVSKDNASSLGLTYTILQKAYGYTSDDTKPLDNQIWYTTTTGKAVNLGVTVADLVSNVYEDGKGIITMADVIEEIPAEMFKQGTTAVNKLSSVALPSKVKTIGDRAFQGCDELASATIPEGLVSFGIMAFQRCSNLHDINIPSSVTSIGNYAFAASGITSAVLPSGITSIGVSAFGGCPSLSSVDLSATVLSAIDDYMFQYSANLKDVSLPPTLVSIGHHAFEGCKALGDIVLPDGFTTLGYETFKDASVTSILLPATFTTSNTRTFSGCAGKLIVGYDSSVTSLSTTTASYYSSGQNSRFEGNKFCEVEFTGNVTCIGTKMFYGSSDLRKITIPSSVKIIGEQAFQGCGLESVKVPSTVDLLGGWAFSGNTSLTEIIIEDGFESIPHQAFSGCPNVKTITLPSSISFIGSQAFAGTSGGTIEIMGDIETESNGGFSGSLINGAEIKAGVTAIPDYFFSGCVNLSSLSLPPTLKSIGMMAFYKCKSLESITVPDGVTAIGDFAFSMCYGLEEAQIPASVTNYGWRVFDEAGKEKEDNVIRFYCNLPDQDPHKDGDQNPHYENLYFDNIIIGEGVSSVGQYGLAGSKMTALALPNSLRKIGVAAFIWEDNLSEVTIPDGVTTLGSSAFYGCASLSKAYIPASVTDFGETCFYGANLEDVTMAEGLKSIGASAFSGPIKELTIPSTVTRIGNYAIPVDNLETLNMLPPIPPCTPECFSGTPKLDILRIVVPVDSYYTYLKSWNGIYGIGRYSYKNNIFPDGELPDNYGDPGHAGEDLEEKDENTYNF